MRNVVLRAVIAGAGALAIMSGVGGTDLVGQAHADDPVCVADAVDSCPRLADTPKPYATPRSHIRVSCQPAGIFGQHCRQLRVP